MKKILIVEDDENIAELERDYLKLNGYRADIEPDGQKACQKALGGGYAALIIDLMLPGKNGFDIIRDVRSTQEVPIIVVSAKAEDIDKIRGLDVGADDYLTKPFSPAELIARVQSHIRRYERLKGNKTQEEILSFRGLEIHHAARRVTVSGREVQLTAKEYDLLYFLASNPNIVFTKEHLFDTIWGVDDYGDLATVPVHIQRIRKKIEKDPSNPDYIETLWGTGYRFHG
ncbi:response regulator transcription factor [Ethanoligenens harbinense]|uniref:Stage 0 sporulation protein A homolog n=1 Tax=Ethanoligenens harbinense (strain DSM 18485 / JCM 12961 / CGMCC 1.5033 / YUAN-3) TaxID=663278 RepID=E6U4Q2_ETHHY|nr:response regulator transcription factor [Ethanoligenens harbinense]ADU26680.1 two component transcriptional regulator, winged helix family [Ethanoligenens harbinense YUAN-3]AVQ95797.1 DNA-binding response regulator [Ethanoligenens harbinense YUAN-3]AYF38459.1 DNA-binding response regulator [Ethanoligenens harbinense]AYF41204.1 DNA-binding response regulator [Ethanoligenens harbinense]QCN92037.1 DNA-binding response regulator [Ethanoligenens harbinense]